MIPLILNFDDTTPAAPGGKSNVKWQLSAIDPVTGLQTISAYVDDSAPPDDDSAYLPLAGGTMTGPLIFTDNTIDIGASNATRPRTLYLGTKAVMPQLDILGSSSGDVTINAAAAAGTWTLTLPSTAGTSGQFLQTNGSGVCGWGTAAAGASGAASSFDSHPTSPDARNDEFETGSLNGAWTVVRNNVGVVDFSSRVPGSIYVKFTGNQGYTISKPFTPAAADFSVTVKGNFKVAAAFDGFNLMITDTQADLIATPGTANGNGVVMAGNGTGIAMQINKWIAGSRTQFNFGAGMAYTLAGAGGAAQTVISTYFGGKIYLHIQRVGGTWTSWYSFDGETFMNSANWGSPPTYTAVTPAFVVIALESYGATSTRMATLDFVRFNWLFF